MVAETLVNTTLGIHFSINSLHLEVFDNIYEEL